MTFSKPFGFLDAGGDWNDALRHIRQAGDSAAWVGQNPWFYRVCECLLFPLIGNPFGVGSRNGAIRDFAVTQSKARQQQGTPHQSDIMEKLLGVHEKQPQAFDDSAVYSIAATNIFASAETTSSSIRATLYFLLKNKKAMAKLQQEIDRTCREHSRPLGRSIPIYIAESMEYLQAVLYESMRLSPANSLPLARVSPPEGLEINGKYFPPGVQLTVFSWTLHRNKQLFGQGAADFQPERWLDHEQSQDLHRYFFSFGSGTRACLGRKLAWMEMLKAISSICRSRYTFSLQDPHAVWKIEGSFVRG